MITCFLMSVSYDDSQGKIETENRRNLQKQNRLFMVSDCSEFVVFKFQLITHIQAEGQQGDGNLGDNAGVLIFDVGIVSANINDGTDHDYLLTG